MALEREKSNTGIFAGLGEDLVDLGHVPCAKITVDASAQAITTSTWSDLILPTVDYDFGELTIPGQENPGGTVNFNPLTIRRSGVYLITVRAFFQLNATGDRFVGVGINWSSGGPTVSMGGMGASTTFSVQLDLAEYLNLNVGDTVSALVYHNRGSNLDILGLSANEITSLSIALVAAGKD